MTTSTPDFFNVLSSRTVECSNNCSATETFYVNNKLCFKSFKNTNSASHNLYINFSRMHSIVFAAVTKSAIQRRHHHAGLALPKLIKLADGCFKNTIVSFGIAKSVVTSLSQQFTIIFHASWMRNSDLEVNLLNCCAIKCPQIAWIQSWDNGLN